MNAPKAALTTLCLSMLMPSLDTSIANAGLPSLAQALQASFSAVQWIVLAYLLAITTLIVSAGRLGDLLGRRRLLLAGIGVFTLASLLCGLAPTLGLLVAARALQGLGAAIMMALTVSFVGETVPKEKIGRAMGLLGTMSAIGTTLGPSLGGLLISGFGWPSIFLINVPLGILNGFLAWRFLPLDQARPAVRPRFDGIGTVLLAVTLGAYALAMTQGQPMIFLAIALVAGGLFIAAEFRSAAPLIPLSMFRDPSLRASLIMSALVATVIMATLVVGPFYLTRGLELDAAQVGLVLSAGPLVAALMGVPAGKLVDRHGAPRMVRWGLIGMSVGALVLSMTAVRFGIPGYVLPIMLMTSHYALFQAANNTMIMSRGGSEQRGVIAGLLSLSRNLGLISGASLMGAIFAFSSGAKDVATADPALVARGLHFTFGVAFGILLLTIGTSYRSSRLRIREP